jgi:hypothetical protein
VECASLQHESSLKIFLGGQMRRRDFIILSGAGATWPLAALAQQGNSLPRVVYLELASADEVIE